MSGQLYQLFSAKALAPGSDFKINGPWDTYGVVIKLIKVVTGKEPYLYLIRGMGHKKFRS